MREIKFRAWVTPIPLDENDVEDYERPFMAYNIQGIYDGMGDESGKLGYVCSFGSMLNTDKDDNPQFKIMQFTGLKDKNGKEIYEGDIVRRDGTEEIGYIFFCENCARFEFQIKVNGDFENGWSSMDMPMIDNDVDGDNYEVIGNIYESNNLIK